MTLRIDSLTKVFPTGVFSKKVVLEKVNLHVEPGEICILLGANGSGKSTLFKIILGFLKPNQGSISLFGSTHQSVSLRRKIGYVPDIPHFQGFLTASEILAYYGRLFGMPKKKILSRTETVLELVGLSKESHQKTSGYSKGMIQRLAIAQAILHEPDLLLLDEPTSGLDPLGQREVLALIREIHRANPNLSMMISTHSLQEACLLGQRVCILKSGRLEASCSIAELLSIESSKEKKESPKYCVQVYGSPQKCDQVFDACQKFSPRRSGTQIVFEIPDLSSLMSLMEDLKHKRDLVISISDNRAYLEEKIYGKVSSQAPIWLKDRKMNRAKPTSHEKRHVKQRRAS